ncbi:MAG: ABC transporter ATP-binding protein [Cyanobacteria bacterium J083]|nr:MAG: ABC transporter ATP-binding protein [Cyanobacteria bacterium J083]
MATVKLQKVTRRFEQTIAINNINLDIPDGEFWVLVGPSGCGKSTILRVIAGLESITEGKIYIGNTLVNNIPARQRDVAMVFQNYALYPHMNVAENLAFGLKMRKTPSYQIKNRVQEVARSLDLEHLLQRKPKQLSGGQQQRVALGRAIARQPELFLLDEPLSNLDAQLRDETRAEIKKLHANLGITTVYVTHDQVEAMTLGDRLVVLDRGKIQQIGTPQQVYNHPLNRMVASFLGSPPMNIFSVTYRQGNFLIEQQTIPVSTPLQEQIKPHEGEVFELGIRAEDIYLRSDNISDFSSLEVKIGIIEPLGKEILVRAHLPRTNNTLLNFLAPANWQGKPNDHLRVYLDLNRLFVFDVSSGQVINQITN